MEPTTTYPESYKWLKAIVGFATVIFLCYFFYESYIYVSDKALLADCNGDKRLFRKIKRGSIYKVDLEGTSALKNIKSSKSWANEVEDTEAAYQKLA